MKISGWMILPMLLAALFAGCNDDDVREPTPLQVTEIVTYRGVFVEGTLFGSQRTDASPVKRLLDPRRFDMSGVAVGTRLLMVYNTEVNDTMLNPVPIRTQGLYSINFDTIRWLPKSEIRKFAPAQAEVVSSWKTGDFLNLQVRLNYVGERCGFTIVGDKATKNDDEAALYLLRTGSDAEKQGVERRTVGSFYCPGLKNYSLY